MPPKLLPVPPAPPARRAILMALAGLAALPAFPARAGAPRLVAAGGAITEVIYALGRQHLLVGIDSTSQFPPDALKEKPDIGYLRALSAEGILSLMPDRVLAVEGAGPPAVLAQLREAGVPVDLFGEDFTEAGVLARIRGIGAAVGAGPEAERLAQTVAAGFARLAEARGRGTPGRRVLFVLSLQNGRVLAGGRATAADAIIRLAGGVNAASAIEGYKPLSDEGLIAAAPELVLMMRRGDHAARAQDVFSQASFAATPAAHKKALVSMDGLYLLGFGPRTPDAARDLMQAMAEVGP